MEEIRMRILMCVGALSLAAAGAIQAQGGTARLPAGNAIGVTVDRFQVEDFHLMAATFHLSSLQPNAFTPEFAISVFPQAFAAGILATNIDVGGAINLSLPRASLLLRGGYILRKEKYRLMFTLGIENLTNRLYFEHFQTAPAPGRSIVFGTTLEILNLLEKK
jgi:hypothetical protein